MLNAGIVRGHDMAFLYSISSTKERSQNSQLTHRGGYGELEPCKHNTRPVQVQSEYLESSRPRSCLVTLGDLIQEEPARDCEWAQFCLGSGI